MATHHITVDSLSGSNNLKSYKFLTGKTITAVTKMHASRSRRNRATLQREQRSKAGKGSSELAA
jgi:hypothetical protein